MSSFKDLHLPKPIQQTLAKMNFTELTPVQEAAIPASLKKEDLVVCAQTGSGKTLAYSLPLLSALFDNPELGGLILAPSRELARQISDVVRPFVENTKNLKMSVIVGGTDMRRQVNSLKRKPQIIIATPGRLNDHLRRKSVNLSNFSQLVLDEGDRMLDMGFAPQLEEIFKFLPEKRTTFLFTATLPNKIKSLIKDYMISPTEISIGPKSKPVETIKQKIVLLKPKAKENRLLDELNQRDGSVIIFTKTKMGTDKLSKYLNEFGFKVSKIHGDRSQGQRNKAIQDFRDGKYRILCATDVVARGLDVPHIKHVINYDLPMMDEDYVHRIGRTARNGEEGEALSFVTPHEQSAWKRIQRKYKLDNIEFEGFTEGAPSSEPRSRFERAPQYKKARSSNERASYGNRERTGEKTKRSSEDYGSERPRFKAKAKFQGQSERSEKGERSAKSDRSGSFSKKSKSKSFGGPKKGNFKPKRKRFNKGS